MHGDEGFTTLNRESALGISNPDALSVWVMMELAGEFSESDAETMWGMGADRYGKAIQYLNERGFITAADSANRRG